jgi:hypothetical protein
MKNIHVLPTEKPSRLKQNKITKKYSLVTKGIDLTMYTPQNIYIASDVTDINENDYIITQDGRLVQVSYLLSKDLEGASKVILTTDQDLIKNDVQAIDDEFLEWFVKNPSCEEVETFKVWWSDDSYSYEIIIPKEDWLLNNPQCKQIESCSKSLSKKCICPKEEPKQETLEEAAKRYATDMSGTYYEDLYNAFINGAKWQQEQDKNKYSAEEQTDILEVGQILVNEETLEYGLLQYIKICLECNNESQAIRLLEKYGFEKQEERYSEEEVLEILNKFSASCYSPIEKFEIPVWFKKNKNK